QRRRGVHRGSAAACLWSARPDDPLPLSARLRAARERARHLRMSTAALASPPPASTPTAAPLIALRGATKRFVKPLDLAARIGQRLGTNVREEVVHAVDHVDLAVAPGE